MNARWIEKYPNLLRMSSTARSSFSCRSLFSLAMKQIQLHRDILCYKVRTSYTEAPDRIFPSGNAF